MKQIIMILSILTIPILNGVEPNPSYLDGSSRVSNALLCLDQAINLSLTIREESKRSVVSSYLRELKDTIQSACQRRDFSNIQDECLCFHENIDEVLAELDPEIRSKIASCVCSMMKEVES